MSNSTAAPVKSPTTFSSCAKVKRVSSGGIAESKAAASRVKGKQTVSAKLYRKYRKWDRNKDGVLCGPKDAMAAAPRHQSVTGVRTLACPAGMTLTSVKYDDWEYSPPSWDVDLHQGRNSASLMATDRRPAHLGRMVYPRFTIECYS